MPPFAVAEWRGPRLPGELRDMTCITEGIPHSTCRRHRAANLDGAREAAFEARREKARKCGPFLRSGRLNSNQRPFGIPTHSRRGVIAFPLLATALDQATLGGLVVVIGGQR
jgi:hypothetical protein